MIEEEWRVNAKEIKEFNFDKGAFGYKVEEVNACLQDISNYVASLEKKISDMESELKSLQQANERLTNNEESVKDIIISAQKFSSTILGEAKLKAKDMLEDAEQKSLAMTSEGTEKSEKIIAEATEKSKSISAVAKQDADKEAARLKELQKQVSDFKAKLLSIYKAHLDIITKMPEDKKSHEAKAPVSNLNSVISEPKKDFQSKSKTETQEEVIIPNEKQNISLSSKPSSENSKSSNFKITITENKPEKSSTHETKEKTKKFDDKFASKFGELKFGEHASK